MFVTTPSATAITATTPVLFTRAGSFTPDSAGYLKNAAGLYLQAWPANSTGVIQDNGASLNGLHPVNVNSIGGAVSPTTSVALNGNLNSAQTINAMVTAGTYSPTTAADSMAGGGVTPDVTMTVQVSDSQGGQHTLQYDFLKSSTPNQWYAEIQTVPTSDVATAAGGVAGQIAYGTVAFNSDGSIDLADTSLPLSLTIGASSAGAGTTTPVNAPGSNGVASTTAPGATNGAAWASSFGVNTQTIALNLSPGSGSSGLTQESSASQQSSSPVNGTPYGTLSSVAISTSGIITASFSTGASRVIGQVALATFPNANGLTAVSGDAYAASTTSGAYDLEAPGPNGPATITSSALESSTVDLSSEFANLIVTQRAYTASSKIITTADSMVQDLLSIIR
jgi:flagellar hook protein FlgE